jgi:predicted dehydrogenase
MPAPPSSPASGPTRRAFLKAGAAVAGTLGLQRAFAPTLRAATAGAARLRVVIIGLTHGHVSALLQGGMDAMMDLAGIYEPDRAVAAEYRSRFGLPAEQFHADLPAMLEAVRPQAAWVFTDTFSHLAAVEACAPRGVHVMMEKPLAVSLAHAQRMAALARRYHVHLLTNYETSWYPSFHDAFRLAVTDEALGPVTKIMGYFGHPGPAEMAVPAEFLAWLTDPRRNGGGASMDFGCYGANLVTGVFGNRRPLAVTAIFQTNKPALYERVDDQAVLVLEYPGAQAVIQASWDWPFPRKDLEIHGRSGMVRTRNPYSYDLQPAHRTAPVTQRAAALAAPYRDPVDYFAAVIRGRHAPAGELSSLENNLIVTEILDAARDSARERRRVALRE